MELLLYHQFSVGFFLIVYWLMPGDKTELKYYWGFVCLLYSMQAFRPMAEYHASLHRDYYTEHM